MCGWCLSTNSLRGVLPLLWITRLLTPASGQCNFASRRTSLLMDEFSSVKIRNVLIQGLMTPGLIDYIQPGIIGIQWAYIKLREAVLKAEFFLD